MLFRSIATGICVAHALSAAKLLNEVGVEARVINIHTIKPLDEALILETAKMTKQIFTVEEHSIIGGLGSAITEFLSNYYPTNVTRIGIEDTYCESGSCIELLEKYELDDRGIYKRIINVMNISENYSNKY